MDSPRGRIYLMKEGLEDQPLTPSMVRHFDLCLGCLACVTACPSGVRYEKLIEDTRQQVERRHRRPLADRLFRAAIYSVLPYPRRLGAMKTLLKASRRLGLQRAVAGSRIAARSTPRLNAMARLAPSTRPTETVPPWTPARGAKRMRVGMLLGCIQQSFFSLTNAATVRVLAAEGCEVVAPSRGCCGALSLHAGREEEAMRFARQTIEAFEDAGVEAIAVNVAGCGSAMKEYGTLLRDDQDYSGRAIRFSRMVRDVSELLVDLGPVAELHPLNVSAVYHDACHLAHGQGIRDQPRALLRSIPGLDLREVQRERDICCGSAGTYNLLQPGPARELGDRKAAAVIEVGGQLLVTANPGCHLQIQSSMRGMGTSLPAAHLMDVLDASIRGLSSDTLLELSAD
jgi:glycolate oxidase iron-sulfur subunit